MSTDLYSLAGDFFLHPTPAGAYFAASRPSREPARVFLQRLLREAATPRLQVELVQAWMGMSASDALEFVYRMQSAGLVQGLPVPVSVPPDSVEALLPPLLAQLAEDGRALLADQRGLYLGTAGFTHEAAEELAALGADIGRVHERHSQMLHGNLRLRGDGWGLIGANGASELGFWPLYMGDEYFILILAGAPRFNQEAFTTLMWTLGVRYGASV
ncbi:MAG: hypothetical protein RIQ60_1299 [Pseudomonadota bacterium]|jgi:hypothetical protein